MKKKLLITIMCFLMLNKIQVVNANEYDNSFELCTKFFKSEYGSVLPIESQKISVTNEIQSIIDLVTNKYFEYITVNNIKDMQDLYNSDESIDIVDEYTPGDKNFYYYSFNSPTIILIDYYTGICWSTITQSHFGENSYRAYIYYKLAQNDLVLLQNAFDNNIKLSNIQQSETIATDNVDQIESESTFNQEKVIEIDTIEQVDLNEEERPVESDSSIIESNNNLYIILIISVVLIFLIGMIIGIILEKVKK